MNVLLIGSSGYIGSYLQDHVPWDIMGWKLLTCDIRARDRGRELPNQETEGTARGLKKPDLLCRYQDISGSLLKSVDVILFFAGCSSVSAALDDPAGAIRENAIDLWRFAERLSNQYLIYASSASVYDSRPARFRREEKANSNVLESGSGGHESKLDGTPPRVLISDENAALAAPTNAYDASKAAADYLLAFGLSNATGLRMGTLSGFSQQLRPELVFNSMCISAARTGRVRVSSPENYRSLLFLDDLMALVMSLLVGDFQAKGAPRLVNCGSYNLSIGELAQTICDQTGAEMVEEAGTSTYSFLLETGLMRSIMAESSLLPARVSLKERVEVFSTQVNTFMPDLVQ